jgi:hypothetical protein
MSAKSSIDTCEGPEAEERFVNAMKAILAVPRSEILRREAEYKKQSALNPRKRGPKPKRKPASRAPAASPRS